MKKEYETKQEEIQEAIATAGLIAAGWEHHEPTVEEEKTVSKALDFVLSQLEAKTLH